MIFKNIHCIERTEHVLEELDICAIKVYVYYNIQVTPCELKRMSSLYTGRYQMMFNVEEVSYG